MCSVGPGAGETETLLGLGDDVGQGRRITTLRVIGKGLQLVFGHDDGPGKGGWIATVDDHRVEAIMTLVFGQPLGAAFLHYLGALLDAPTVENHHRNRHPAVLGTPPARRPVRATLLLEGAIT